MNSIDKNERWLLSMLSYCDIYSHMRTYTQTYIHITHTRTHNTRMTHTRTRTHTHAHTHTHTHTQNKTVLTPWVGHGSPWATPLLPQSPTLTAQTHTHTHITHTYTHITHIHVHTLAQVSLHGWIVAPCGQHHCCLKVWGGVLAGSHPRPRAVLHHVP
jgi:hypothetical protein